MYCVERKSICVLSIVFMMFIAFTFLTFTSQAGVIDPKLKKRLAELKNNDEISVIIEMSDKADLKLHPDKPAKLRALRDTASKSQEKILDKLSKDSKNGKVKKFKSFWLFNGIATTVTKAEVQELAVQQGVKEIREDTRYQIPPVIKANTNGAEWNIDKVRAPEVWQAFGIRGNGIIVANMDTGVDVQHPDLNAQYRGGLNSWYDSINGMAEPYDDNGHGTHTMGTICGLDKSGAAIGVAPGATWIATKAFDSSGSGMSSWIHDSFQWLADPDGNPGTDDAPDVVNNSWGSDGANTEFLLDVQSLNRLGIFTAFANGNAGPGAGSVGAPASYSFGVGATDISDIIADFSSRGPSPIDGSIKPNVSAPGANVKSSLPGGGYGWGYGTSMATPHVTGAIALLLEANPSLSIDQIAETLQNTAVDLGAGGPDNDYGWGRIDIYQAVSMVAHTGTLVGTVKDANTGTPLIATVTLLETGTKANTDPLTGWYSMKAPAGPYTAKAEALSYPPQTAPVTIIEGRTVIQDFALSLVDPLIAVSPVSISLTMSSGEKTSRELTISNVGPSDSGLRFNIQEGLLAQDFPWISEKPESGNVVGGDSQVVEALFDTTGLLRGVYAVDLLISSNDRTHSLVTVHVELTVLEPDITVAPAKFDVNVEYNTTHKETMTITNKGDGELKFKIIDKAISAPKPAVVRKNPEPLPPNSYPVKNPNKGQIGPNHAPIPPVESPMAKVIPSLDGIYTPGEWDDAVSLSVTPIIDPAGMEMGKVYIKNSAGKLYVLIDQYTQSGNSVYITGDIWLDLDNNGSNDGGFYTEVAYGNVYTSFYYPGAVRVGESPTPDNPLPHWIFEYEIPLSGLGLMPGALFGVHFVLYNNLAYEQAGEWYNSSNDFDYNYPNRWGEILLSDWLTEFPTAGELKPGESMDITLTFDATGLRNGKYLADVLIINNDPDSQVVKVPTSMEVYNAPQAIISVSPESFDKVMDGWTKVTDTMTISNLGNIPLNFEIFDKEEWIYVEPASGIVQPGGSAKVTLTFKSDGLEDGDYYANILIKNNDLDRPELLVPAHIKVINAPKPDIDVSPISFDETLPKGYKISRAMTIKNTAKVAPLKLNILDGFPVTSSMPKFQNNQQFSVNKVESAKKETGERISGNPVIAGLGGPDAFGYKWIDSDEPGGPVFDWVDIKGFGTQIKPLGDDWSVGPFDIGFDFPFYGTKFNKFNFCTNGFISFTSMFPQNWNTPLPSLDAPENLIAPFWSDLNFSNAGEAYYWSNGVDTLVVAYYDVPHWFLGGSYTFEIILKSNGAIAYQYKKMSVPTDWTTVGVQNGDRTIGLQVVFNYPYIHDNMTIIITPDVPWLTEEPTKAVLMPGESIDVKVTFDTTELKIGDYEAVIAIVSNDPTERLVTVPVSLKVREILLSLIPANKKVSIGEAFTLELQIDTQGVSINGVSAYISFDDTFLNVVSGGKDGLFTPGNFIKGTVLENNSNKSGKGIVKLDYSEGLATGVVKGKGTLASFSLSAKGLPKDSGVAVPIKFDFDLLDGRQTAVSLAGGSVIKPNVSEPAAIITIMKGDSSTTTWDISGKAMLEGRKNHSATINFELKTVGDAKPILVRDIDTDANGAFTIEKIAGGTYELTAKEFHYLRGISKPISLPPVEKSVTFDSGLAGSSKNALRAGDCNNDNIVDLRDFAILGMFFGKSATKPANIPKPEDPPTSWNADIDGSGVVDNLDLTLIAGNFGEQGVPNSTMAAPINLPLAGTNQGSTLAMQASAGHKLSNEVYGLPLDEVFDLQVIAENTTDIRGYSFVLEYDLVALQIVKGINGVASEEGFLKQTNTKNSSLFFSQLHNNASLAQGITIAASMTGSCSGVSGKGTMASLRLKLVGKQTNTLYLRNILLVDSRGNLTRLPDKMLSIRAIPRTASLLSNYPNPFNPETWIPFELSEESQIVIRIYNIDGQLIRTLDLGVKISGFYTDKHQAAYWDGQNEYGEKASSGIYFYTIQAGNLASTKKMVLTK